MAGGFLLSINYQILVHLIIENIGMSCFILDNGKQLVYSDIRRFGELRNLATYNDYPAFLEIAPEPFDDNALNYF